MFTTALLGSGCVVLSATAFSLWRKNSKLVEQIGVLQNKCALVEKQLHQAIQKLSEYETAADRDGDGLFQKVVDGLVGLGVPGLVLLFAMATSGFAGAAAITTALASLGGPFGMLGGIAVLLLLALASRALSRYGLPKLAHAVMRGLVAKGESPTTILTKVKALPEWVVSAQLRSSIEQTLAERQAATLGP